MMRRWLQLPTGFPFSGGSLVRSITDWQPRAKQRLRYSKAALQQSRGRHSAQREVAALRRVANEEYGVRQRQNAQLRRRSGAVAEALIHGAAKTSQGSAANALEAARHLLMVQEAARKAMKGGKGGRKEMFVSSKKWRG